MDLSCSAYPFSYIKEAKVLNARINVNLCGWYPGSPSQIRPGSRQHPLFSKTRRSPSALLIKLTPLLTRAKLFTAGET